MTDLPRKGDGHHGLRPIFFLDVGIYAAGATVALSVAIKMITERYRTEAEKQEIEKERTQAELAEKEESVEPAFPVQYADQYLR